jgi:hypothetical protein
MPEAWRAGRRIPIAVSRSPELAREYGVAVVPTVAGDGTVLDRLAP